MSIKLRFGDAPRRRVVWNADYCPQTDPNTTILRQSLPETLPTKFIDGMEREQYCMDQPALSKTVWRQILESIVDDKLALLQRMIDASHR